MTSLTFISPDGKLMTHKKYANWEGVREVEGSGTVLPINAHTAERSMIQRDLHCKTIIDIKYCDFTLLSFLPAPPPAITMHQPDFTEAHYWSKDSIWVVEESNTGSARTPQPGEQFEVVCDFMQCADSITTFLRTPHGNGDTISYRKIQTGYWRIYRNGERTGQARVETAEVVKTEQVEGYNEDSGESYPIRIEYLKTVFLPDTFMVSEYHGNY